MVVVGRPEGDYALAGDLAGYALMAAGFVLVVVGIVGAGRLLAPLAVGARDRRAGGAAR